MKNRAVRIALFFLAVCAFAGAGYELAMLDRRATAARDAARAFDDKMRQVEATVRELGAAQFAYVAEGQGPSFWTGRATALLQAIASQLRELDALAKAAAAAGSSEAVSPAAALDDLGTVQRIDADVQGYLRNDQPLLASDLIFTDLREADHTLAARLEHLRNQMAASRGAARDSLRKAQAATGAGAALFAILVLLLLVPSGGDRGSDESIGPPRVVPAPEPQPLALPAVPPVAVSGERVDLNEVAKVCTDFGRVRETSQIPALLERVAHLLDATGIIVWAEDRTTRELRPALSFGYAPDALARIHAVRCEDDNATARAYQERALRVVTENPLSNGAIAAPLLGPEGCVGVMAAEIRRGGESRPDVQAAAAIVAAQLATLVAPAASADAAQS